MSQQKTDQGVTWEDDEVLLTSGQTKKYNDHLTAVPAKGQYTKTCMLNINICNCNAFPYAIISERECSRREKYHCACGR